MVIRQLSHRQLALRAVLFAVLVCAVAAVSWYTRGYFSKAPIKPEAHNGITATVFWVGEGATDDNDFIHNRSSAWMGDWVEAFGGIDDPDDRCGYRPCGFKPRENTFYFALPYTDYSKDGMRPKSELAHDVPWYDGGHIPNGSLLKNRWIKITHENKTAYAQWEDVGPFEDDDPAYVFGDAKPKEARAGLDLSPATTDYLGVDGRGVVSWRFVDEGEVPDGPWRDIITRTPPKY